MRSICSALLAALALLDASCASPRGWQMAVVAEDWHLAGFEESLDLSGIASADFRHCLVVSDETSHVQPGRLDPAARRIESRRPVPLVPASHAAKPPEIDLEAVAWSAADSCYYATGSHGLGKKKGDVQPARNTLHRIPYDPATGELDPPAIRSASLLPVLEGLPETAPHVRQALQRNGLNIEGLAAANGRLFVGLRAPNLDGRGLVIELDPATVFEDGRHPPRVHFIDLGTGRGIREITAVRDGFLLLTGNASAEASKLHPESLAPGPDDRFDLLHWHPADGRRATPLGTLPRNGGKAEALLVLQDTRAALDCLVIFDGLPGGAPVNVRITREPSLSPESNPKKP